MNNIDFTQENYFNNINTILNSLHSGESELITIEDIENIIPHAEAGLKNFHRLKPKLRKKGNQYLKNRIEEIRKLIDKKEITYFAERLNWLTIIEELVSDIFLDIKIELQPNIKLRINAPNNVIYDLIRQLKTKCVEGNKPIFPQSYKHIAYFLKTYIENFKDSNIESIENQLEREQLISKEKIYINIK